MIGMSILIALLLQSALSTGLAIASFILLLVVFVWWSLGAAHLSFFDRVSVALLAPFYGLMVWTFAIANSMRGIASLFEKIHKLHLPSSVRSQ